MQKLLRPSLYALIFLLAGAIKGIAVPKPSDTGGLKVMTYNIHHANPPAKEAEGTIDLQAIARVINEAKPDLVALQEIDVHTKRSGPGVNEAEVLAKLTGMQAHFSRALSYQGGAYGVAVLSRLPITDTFTYQLPVEKNTKEETRVLCLIKIQLPDHRDIYFGSTHLGLSEPTRILQVKRLKQIIQPLSLPVILGGDFNAHPDSKPIQMLEKVFERSCTSNCGFTISAQHPRNKIDYIMFKPKNSFSVVEHQVIQEKYASDHLPYLAIFMLKKK